MRGRFLASRTVLRRVRIDVGLMLAQALPQIVGGADIEMTGHSYGFENVDVTHGRLAVVCCEMNYSIG